MKINIKKPSEKTQGRILFVFLVLCAIFLTLRIVQRVFADVCLVPTDSMENAIMAGDRVVVRKTRNINRHDLIVFNHPGGENVQLVKRCMGLPGDTVSIVRGAVYINGRINIAIPTVLKSSFDYPLDFPLRTLEWNSNNFGPVITPAKGLYVPLDSVNMNLYRYAVRSEGSDVEAFYPAAEYTFLTDSYFVLGDNRGNSLDSRHWGFVSEDLIVGRVVMVYFSRDAARRRIRWERIGLQINRQLNR